MHLEKKPKQSASNILPESIQKQRITLNKRNTSIDITNILNIIIALQKQSQIIIQIIKIDHRNNNGEFRATKQEKVIPAVRAADKKYYYESAIGS